MQTSLESWREIELALWSLIDHYCDFDTLRAQEEGNNLTVE